MLQKLQKNLNQIFEIFAAFNNESPSPVYRDIVQHILYDYYAHVGAIHLKHLKLNIDIWIKLMSAESVFADELMIFALSKAYQRHTVIFTNNACLDNDRH